MLYRCSFYYKDGVIKNTTAGDPYPDTSIKAGTIVAGITINCYANSYVGAIADKEFEESDIASLIPTSKQSKDYTHTFKLDMQKSVYMYPKSYKELESIKDSNGFEYISSYVLKTITYDDVEYYVYVLETITIIDKFKQVFS